MQTKSLHIFDYLVFLVYFVIVAGYGYYIYHRKKKKTTDSKDFFLAEGSLTWWAIGASLIASNISAEQFIGMSGNGFNIGLAISTYEWMAAATLIVVAVFFLPIYLKNKIYTMPQFLERRYNQTVSTIMAVFWLLLYVVVNLTSILYLGALAVSTISGINFYACMVMLAFFAILITLGGMKVIGYTDVIQVFFLILGGLATTYLALQLVSAHFGTTGVLKGFSLMTQYAGDHFHMILHKNNPKYLDLPGLSVLIGGMWIVNLNYWGCNQYITQRALGADLKTARSGLLFAGFLKLLMPVIVVLPGIAAYVLYSQNHGDFVQAMMKDGSLNADNAYPVLLNLLPVGLKGLAFAALTAAVVASLAGKANSISTIFSLDIYKKIYNKNADEKEIVGVGRIVVIVTMVIAIVISNFLGIDKKGGFQFIQEYTGFVSPGVFAMFALGFFWKRTTSDAALFAMIGGLLLSFVLKFMPNWINLEPLHAIGFSALNPDSGLYEMAFIDRMGLVFVVCVMGMVLITLADRSSVNNPKGLTIDGSMFKPAMGFTVGALLIIGILIALYTVFW
ncbi:sodium/solute symporter [Chitinophaga sp. 30R24]|uniref:sodium:solute symporter family transporter n=1 Tax=Chitinophaga sp. 30R24 TaxID=3248838 RepID=UPI003B91DBA5